MLGRKLCKNSIRLEKTLQRHYFRRCSPHISISHSSRMLLVRSGYYLQTNVPTPSYVSKCKRGMIPTSTVAYPQPHEHVKVNGSMMLSRQTLLVSRQTFQLLLLLQTLVVIARRRRRTIPRSRTIQSLNASLTPVHQETLIETRRRINPSHK